MKGKIAGVSTEIMLDSGSSVSLLRQEVVLGLKGITRRRPPQNLKLVTASGESLPIVDYVEASVVLGNTELKHYFVVVKDHITPVILGVDFLQVFYTSQRPQWLSLQERKGVPRTNKRATTFY